jgi:hypothetical protein
LRRGIDEKKIVAFKKDEWSNVFEFLEAHLNNLRDYSELESWPVLFDQFVEWVKKTPD